MSGQVNPHVWWYAARAGGLVAWGLVSLSVIWGLLLSNRTRSPKPAWTLDLHRFLGGLAVLFTAVHVGTLMLDGWLHLRLSEVLIPLASHWRPLPVALGVVGLWLLLAVELTSLLKRRIPRRWWRGIHFTSYGLFALSTVHALTAGSEAANPVFQWTVLFVSAAVLFLTLVRVLAAGRRSRPLPARSRRALPATTRVSPARTAGAGQPLYASRRPGVSQSQATRRPVPDTVM